MRYAERKKQLLALYEEFNEEKRLWFYYALGNGLECHYTEQQKKYAFELIQKIGIRATAKCLKIPRRTLQRWCGKYNIYVKYCPDWVYGWAERRNKRRLFWATLGYS